MFEYVSIESPLYDLVGYNVKSPILEVHFVDTGYTFAYEDVPEDEFNALLDAKSKEKYLQYIIDSYEGYRVNTKQSR